MVEAEGGKGWAAGRKGDKVMMNGVGDAIVLKFGKEKGKCKKKPAELEEGEKVREELGDGKPWNGNWYWGLQHYL